MIFLGFFFSIRPTDPISGNAFDGKRKKKKGGWPNNLFCWPSKAPGGSSQLRTYLSSFLRSLKKNKTRKKKFCTQADAHLKNDPISQCLTRHCVI